jgi:hypothetical protein
MFKKNKYNIIFLLVLLFLIARVSYSQTINWTTTKVDVAGGDFPTMSYAPNGDLHVFYVKGTGTNEKLYVRTRLANQNTFGPETFIFNGARVAAVYYEKNSGVIDLALSGFKSIYILQSKDNGLTWMLQKTYDASASSNPCYLPLYFCGDDDNLMLFYGFTSFNPIFGAYPTIYSAKRVNGQWDNNGKFIQNSIIRGVYKNNNEILIATSSAGVLYSNDNGQTYIQKGYDVNISEQLFANDMKIAKNGNNTRLYLLHNFSNGTTGKDQHLSFTYSDDKGLNWLSPQIDIVSDGKIKFYPKFAFDGNRIIVAWLGKQVQTGYTGYQVIYYKISENLGQSWSSTDSILSLTGNNQIRENNNIMLSMESVIGRISILYSVVSDSSHVYLKEIKSDNIECKVNAGNDITICKGNATSLIATGTTSYSWSNGNKTNTISVSPTITTIYTVTGTQGTCTATDNVVVAVVNPPIANAGPDKTVNKGVNVTLSATGGTSYSWNNGKNTQSIVVAPTTTTTFTVTVKDNNTCTASDIVVINVNLVDVADAGSDITICRLDTTTLSASGGAYYKWSTGSRLQSIVVNPTITTTYKVTATSLSGVTSSDQVVVTVNAVFANAGPDKTICKGTTTTISASGGKNYSWNTGANTASFVATPQIMKLYLVTVSENNCSATDDIIVKVKTPNIDIDKSKTICIGKEIELHAIGGSNYQWSNGATGEIITVSPIQTTTYYLSATDFNNGCSAQKSVIVYVSNCKKLVEENNISSDYSDFNIYPNPSNTSNIIISGNFINNTAKIKIYNILGEKVFENTYYNLNNNIIINSSILQSGIYSIVIENNKTKVYKKFIKL